MIDRDVFVALAIVVAKAPYILESDGSILVLLQARMINCGKVSEFVGQIGGRGSKAMWRIVCTFEKILATPLN